MNLFLGDCLNFSLSAFQCSFSSTNLIIGVTHWVMI